MTKRKVVFVGGPPSSGKTTLTIALESSASCYVERGIDNPHLLAHGAGGPFDVAANQRWFLERIAEFYANTTSSPVVIDQHLRAIGEVYPAAFVARGLLDAKVAAEISQNAATLEREIRQNADVLTVQLSASWQTLCARAVARDGGFKLEPAIVRRVGVLFNQLVLGGECLFFNTDTVTVEEEVEAITRWLQAPSIVSP